MVKKIIAGAIAFVLCITGFAVILKLVNKNKKDTFPTEKIYGVKWENDSTTTMTRTDNAVDMFYIINAEDGSITSDFDNVFPWNEAEKTELDAGSFLKLPDMWFRVGTDKNGDINSVAVSKAKTNDGDWYKVDSFYYALYGASTSDNTTLKSVSGVDRACSFTRGNFRDMATATGSGYQQLDLYHKTVMNFLWWIEFATKNSESVMTGKTATTGSTACLTGGTDSVSTPSGYNVETKQMRYHYIEDFVGNYFEFIDGVSGSTDNKVWVSSDAGKYSDTVGADGYSQLSYISGGSGWIYSFGWDNNNAFLCYPRLTNGSTQGGFSNYCNVVSSSNAVVSGGAHFAVSSSGNGICGCNSYVAAAVYNYFSARLIYNAV